MLGAVRTLSVRILVLINDKQKIIIAGCLGRIMSKTAALVGRSWSVVVSIY